MGDRNQILFPPPDGEETRIKTDQEEKSDHLRDGREKEEKAGILFPMRVFLMFQIHRHQWTETERIVAQPAKEVTSMKGGDPELIKTLLLGQTTIILTCSECGDKKKIEVVGS